MPEFIDNARFENCRSKAKTDKAVLVVIPDVGEEVWVPQSQISDDSEIYGAEQEGTLIVSEWFARQRGWV